MLLLLRALLVPKVQLALENVTLRQQVAVLRRSIHRPRVRVRDRLFWVILRRLWAGWQSALGFVQPATVVRWHRASWRLVWRWRSRSKPGRPPVALGGHLKSGQLWPAQKRPVERVLETGDGVADCRVSWQGSGWV